MKESPIIFNTEMVRAILDGIKTKTRRLNGLEEINEDPEWYYLSKEYYIDKKRRFCQKFFREKKNNDPKNWSKIASCPYGKTGDLLWVRETFAPALGEFAYKADYSNNVLNEKRNKGLWKPSIHMPKSAARIWLKITDIRIERLMDISNEDAIAEGIKRVGKYRYKNYLKDLNKDFFLSPLPSFRSLFESINGEQIWKANPWVWVITFERIEK